MNFHSTLKRLLITAGASTLLTMPGMAQCNQTKYIDSNALCSNGTGTALAMDGSTLAVGSPNYGSPSVGGVFVLERTGSNWVENQILTALDGADTDRFGDAVAISGNTILVGAPQSRPSGLLAAGSAYVFERINGSWMQTQKLVASDATANSRFGWSVAIYGEVMVVAARSTSAISFESGAIYIFERSGGSWIQAAKVVGNDTSTFDKIGHRVATNGQQVFASSLSATGMEPGAGAVYAFGKVRGNWIQLDKIFPTDGYFGQGFGMSLAVEGDVLAVGADRDSDVGHRVGAVYVYERAGFGWRVQEKVYPVAPEFLGRFGFSVALSGGTLAVGEPTVDGVHTNAGAFSAYRLTESGWQFAIRFREPGAEAASHLGDSIAISGGYIAAGAPGAQNGNPHPQCAIGNVWLVDVAVHAVPYCLGTSCPCGNEDPLAGCAGSSGLGALLAACGSGSVLTDDGTFRASGLPSGQPALLFAGLNSVNGGVGNPLGDGLRCAGGQVRRLGVRFADSTGHAYWGPGLATQGQWTAGDTRHLQAWYRDPSSPCGQGFNTTNGIRVQFEP